MKKIAAASALVLASVPAFASEVRFSADAYSRLWSEAVLLPGETISADPEQTSTGASRTSGVWDSSGGRTRTSGNYRSSSLAVITSDFDEANRSFSFDGFASASSLRGSDVGAVSLLRGRVWFDVLSPVEVTLDWSVAAALSGDYEAESRVQFSRIDLTFPFDDDEIYLDEFAGGDSRGAVEGNSFGSLTLVLEPGFHELRATAIAQGYLGETRFAEDRGTSGAGAASASFSLTFRSVPAPATVILLGFAPLAAHRRR